MITLNEANFFKSIENPSRDGRSAVSGLWEPIASIEGGNATLGYGHKLTNAEIAAGVIMINNIPVPIVTFFTDKQVEDLLQQDVQEAGDFVSANFPNLAPNERLAALDLIFNTGATEFRTPKSLGGKKLSKAFRALKRYNDSGRTDDKARKQFVLEAFDEKRGFVAGGKFPGLITRSKMRETIFNVDVFDHAKIGRQKPSAIGNIRRPATKPAVPITSSLIDLNPSPVSDLSMEASRTETNQLVASGLNAGAGGFPKIGSKPRSKAVGTNERDV